jgi:hypothetical protein
MVLAGAHERLGLRQLPDTFKLNRELDCWAFDMFLVLVLPNAMALRTCLTRTTARASASSASDGSDCRCT